MNTTYDSNASIQNSSFNYSDDFSFAEEIPTLSTPPLSSSLRKKIAEALDSPKLPTVDYTFDESKFSPGKSRRSSVCSVAFMQSHPVPPKKTPAVLLEGAKEKIRQIILAVGLSFTVSDATLDSKLADLKTCINKESSALSFSDHELSRIKTLLTKKVDSLQAHMKPHLRTTPEILGLSLELTKLQSRYITPLTR